MQDLFEGAEIISVYTRRNAIDDGVLVDISEVFSVILWIVRRGPSTSCHQTATAVSPVSPLAPLPPR